MQSVFRRRILVDCRRPCNWFVCGYPNPLAPGRRQGLANRRI